MHGRIRCQISNMTNDFEALKSENDRLKEDFNVQKSDNEHLQQEIALLKAVIVKKDKEISAVKDSFLDQRARSMRNIVRLYNIDEVADKNYESTQKTFLGNHTSLSREEINNIQFESTLQPTCPGRRRTMLTSMSP